MQELESVRRKGYSCNDGELFPGIWALAAPIYDSAEEVCAAVNLVGTKHSPLDDPAAIRVLKGAASQISKRLTKAASSRRSFEDGIHALSAHRFR
jgi:DNA-binding IclR family transcriptional regulator